MTCMILIYIMHLSAFIYLKAGDIHFYACVRYKDVLTGMNVTLVLQFLKQFFAGSSESGCVTALIHKAHTVKPWEVTIIKASRHLAEEHAIRTHMSRNSEAKREKVTDGETRD